MVFINGIVQGVTKSRAYPTEVTWLGDIVSKILPRISGLSEVHLLVATAVPVVVLKQGT